MKHGLGVFAVIGWGLFGCLVPSTEQSIEPVEGPPRVVVLGVDDATIAWASETASVADGRPIGPPGDEARRFREVFARLVDRLGSAASRPSVVALDYMFPPNDGASTALLAAALARAPMPIVLARLDDGLVSTSVHVPAANRFEGHATIVRDLIVTPIGDVVSIETGAWGIPLGGRPLPVAQPLSVATLAAHLLSTGMPREQAMARADAIVRSRAVDYTVAVRGATPTERLPVWPLAEVAGVELVSAADVLSDDAVRSSLAGAIVIIGETTTTTEDQHDLRRDGSTLPGVMAHGWAVRGLLEAAAERPVCAPLYAEIGRCIEVDGHGEGCLDVIDQNALATCCATERDSQGICDHAGY